MKDVYLLAARRTPIGKFLGGYAGLAAPQLGATAIRGALDAGSIEPNSIEQVIMGNVLTAGLGQAPARQASIGAGIPESAGAITLNKVCGSGMRAVMDAANGIRVGDWSAVVAGGMENMSRAPHVLANSRTGTRMGPAELLDTMVRDGLWDPYGNKHMGSCAELCARKYAFSRESQDAFALESYKRAQAAVETGAFAQEIVQVAVPQVKGEAVLVTRDEEPFAAPLDKMGKLRPAFETDGTITAANASKINDGAAALVVASEAYAKQHSKQPLARIVAQATTAQAPEWFTTSPIAATRLALERANLGVKDIDLFEINEAFAVVAMASITELKLDAAKVNVRGGAVALGHPIGCSGARIIVTLLHALQQQKLRYGCASICIGGGEAAAIIIENLQR